MSFFAIRNTRPLLFLSALLLCLGFAASPARAESIQLEPLVAGAVEKGVARALNEAFLSAASRQRGLKVVQSGADFRLSLAVKEFSYSAEIGLAEQRVEAWLLSPSDARVFRASLWGTSGERAGYKGGMDPLLKEAAQDAAQRLAQVLVTTLQSKGMVVSLAEPGYVRFENRYDNLLLDGVVSVLRHGDLLATGRVTDVYGKHARARLEEGAREIRYGDEVILREVSEEPVRWHQFTAVKKKKKKFLGMLLGAIGIGLVVTLATENNNDRPGQGTGPTAPASINLLSDAASVARFGLGAAGQKTTATLTATVLNGSNNTLDADVSFETTAGFVTENVGGNSAVFSPPATSQIVTVTARAAGGVSREFRVHVGGDPARFKAANDSAALQAPQGVDTALTLLAYDANTLDPSGPVLVPTGTRLTAILQTVAGAGAASQLVPLNPDTGAAETAANPATLTSNKNGEFKLLVRRNVAEPNTQLKLVLREAGGNTLSLIGGGDFQVTP